MHGSSSTAGDTQLQHCWYQLVLQTKQRDGRQRDGRHGHGAMRSRGRSRGTTTSAGKGATLGFAPSCGVRCAFHHHASGAVVVAERHQLMLDVHDHQLPRPPPTDGVVPLVAARNGTLHAMASTPNRRCHAHALDTARPPGSQATRSRTLVKTPVFLHTLHSPRLPSFRIAVPTPARTHGRAVLSTQAARVATVHDGNCVP